MENLKYPVGQDLSPEEFSADRTNQQIEEIKSLAGKLRKAVSPLADQQLDTAYRPGGWTVRQVVHHIADSHINSYIRMKWALTEKDTTIKPYNQGAWAELADYEAPVEVSLDLITSLHTRWGYLLDSLTEKQLMIEYNHPESGKQSLWRHIDHYAWHGRHHLAHITSLIERKNW
ncbi:putative metal-dependent hydrolase [Aliifodinibius sp. S!AR15-10]|uniref:YfiT family bacillithiol transferase n=1 Tax=Aliifodinibius sp. S!AR15-10 TaxID=2950437 RepID=UPI00285AF6EB|nr:putative metal-dependent hydrolase [Aliifodinibius sp. S!AR15-10]MDR8391317.1 putative metal-dependent hydrolase [Aliifodinibius sp. S!AR15-10]